MAVNAQSWDAATQARSWAKQDRDDSFTFYDAAAKSLRTWMRDGGLLGSVPTAKLDNPPERWVMDPRNAAWIAHGSTVSQVDRTGHIIVNIKLPAEVGDVCWDAKGFVLSFRTFEPYLEKRDFKGALLWSFGAKPTKGDGPSPRNRRPILSDDSGNVLMADGSSLNLSILDGNTGRKVSETNLKLEGGQPVPALEGSLSERAPMAAWLGKGVVFASMKANQIPPAQRSSLEGQVLARLDLPQSRLEFLPTGLDDTHLLVGILDGDAVFVNPKGGLMLVKVK